MPTLLHASMQSITLKLSRLDAPIQVNTHGSIKRKRQSFSLPLRDDPLILDA